MFTRRDFLKTTAAGSAAALTSGLSMPALAQNAPIKLGYVSPQTGPLAAFGEADSFVIDAFLSVAKSKGLNYEIVVKDSQSNPNRAAEVAKQLIVDDEVNLMLVASTPETTNPVATTCEAEGMPCISTVAPWQPWFIGQQGNPGDPASWKPFDYAYHFFWGLEDVIAVFTNMWAQVETNRKVGGLFPNDGDGNAWGDKELGFPKPLQQMGFTLTDPGRFQSGTQDFSAQISAFKKEGVEIVTGVIIPPDAKTFLTQAKQQGFHPKVVSFGKALMHPMAIESLGELGDGLSTEVWWSPSHPFSSSLTGQSSKALADAYEASTKKQWLQPLAFAHALFEVASDALKRSKSLKAADVRDAVAASKLKTVVGDVAWGGQGPFKNVSKTPLVLGQWGKGKKYKYELTLVNNEAAKSIPVGGTLRSL